jgi:hypothetical protein
MKTMSATQAKVLEEIKNAKVSTPYSDDTRGMFKAWKCEADWTSERTNYTWKAGRVYGRFNTATIKALEKLGLIKIHEIGGGVMPDTIEII